MSLVLPLRMNGCRERHGGASFVDHLCYFVNLHPACLFINALWSPAEKRAGLLALVCDVLL